MKNILIGVSSSIASYKICELTRLFKKNGYEVKIVITPATVNLVAPLTLEALSGNPVYLEQFASRTSVEHISLCDWADCLIMAPLSANTLSKIANGISDNLLTSIFCAYLGHKKPIILAPAMNTGMWENPFVQENLKKLEQKGCKTLEPETGFLACGVEDKGRLCSLDKILNAASEDKPLSGKKIVITAGGTKEKIDPVRHITNASSGKMGIALADCAYSMGAEVELVCTFEIKKPYKTTLAQSTDDMLEATSNAFISNKSDCLIMSAAVSDYKIKNPSQNKISKEKMGEKMTLELELNPDILKTMCEKKSKEQIAIGFSLGTENIVELAKEKLDKKGCDFIIANDAKIALNSDENEIYIINKDKNVKKIEKNTKECIARAILKELL